MIARALDIFVERVPLERVGPRLVSASRLLLIDACARPVPGDALTAQLAQSQRIAAELVRFDRLGESHGMPRFDAAWILIDSGSDRIFCELLRDEIARDASGDVHLLAVGEFECDAAFGRLELRHFGGGRPWRRRRDLTDGADAVLRLLANGEATP